MQNKNVYDKRLEVSGEKTTSKSLLLISLRSQKNLKNDSKKATGCNSSRWENGTSWSDLEASSDDEEIIEKEDSVDG